MRMLMMVAIVLEILRTKLKRKIQTRSKFN